MSSLKPGITAQIMVRNEEWTIWECLMSVIPFVDEAIVYDTGSTDKTVSLIQDVIKRFPDKINFVQREHPDLTMWGQGMKFYPSITLGAVRNEMQAMTKTELILTVDADEVYPRAALDVVLDTVNRLMKPNPGMDCIYVPLHWFGKNLWEVCDMANPSIYFLTGRMFRNRPGYEHRGVFPGECAHYDGVIPRPSDKNCLAIGPTELPRMCHYEMTTKPWRRNVVSFKPFPKEQVPEVFELREREIGPGLLTLARENRVIAVPKYIEDSRMR